MTTEEFYTAMLESLDNIKTIDEASSAYLETIRQTFLTYEDDLDALKSGQSVQNSSLSSIRSDIRTTRNDTLLIREATQTLLERVLFGYYHSSGRLTGSGAVRQVPGYLGGVIVNTNGVNNASVIVYDNTVASGKILYSVTVAGLDRQGGIYFGLCPIRFEIGCTRALSGTSAKCYIYYR